MYSYIATVLEVAHQAGWNRWWNAQSSVKELFFPGRKAAGTRPSPAQVRNFLSSRQRRGSPSEWDCEVGSAAQVGASPPKVIAGTPGGGGGGRLPLCIKDPRIYLREKNMPPFLL